MSRGGRRRGPTPRERPEPALELYRLGEPGPLRELELDNLVESIVDDGFVRAEVIDVCAEPRAYHVRCGKRRDHAGACVCRYSPVR